MTQDSIEDAIDRQVDDHTSGWRTELAVARTWNEA